MDFWHGLTNPKWLNVKALYFLLYGALGAVLPYLSLYLISRQSLSAGQIGFIELLATFIGSLSKPLFGTIADRTSRHKIVLGWCILTFTIFVVSISFVPVSMPHDGYPVSLTCREQDSHFKFQSCEKRSNDILSNTKNLVYFNHSSENLKQNCTLLDDVCSVTCEHTLVNGSTSLEPFGITRLHIGKSSNVTINGTSGDCISFPVSVIMSPEDSHHPSLVCDTPSHQTSCKIDCRCGNNSAYNTAMQEEKEANKKRTFVTILMLRSLGAIPFGPSVSLTDSITYDLLGAKHRNLWGQQRMFGTLSWGIIAGVMGPILDATGVFELIFYTLGVCGIGASMVSFLWLPRYKPQHTECSNQRPVPFFQALISVLRIPLYSITCVVAFASGMLMAIVWIVFPVYMVKDLQTMKWMVGAASSICCAIEVPCLFFSGHVVTFLGESVCFMLMFLAFGIRFLVSAFLTPTTAWIVLPLQILHVFCFAFFYAAATRIAASIAPPGTSATVQAILAACYFGVGMGVGNFLSMEIYQIFGGQRAFQIYSVFAFILFAILFILHWAYLRNAMARVRKAQVAQPEANPNVLQVDDVESSSSDDKCEVKQALTESPYI